MSKSTKVDKSLLFNSLVIYRSKWPTFSSTTILSSWQNQRFGVKNQWLFFETLTSEVWVCSRKWRPHIHIYVLRRMRSRSQNCQLHLKIILTWKRRSHGSGFSLAELKNADSVVHYCKNPLWMILCGQHMDEDFEWSEIYFCSASPEQFRIRRTFMAAPTI